MTISRPKWVIFSASIYLLTAGLVLGSALVVYSDPGPPHAQWPVPDAPALSDPFRDKLAAVERTIVANRAVACLPYGELIARVAYIYGLDAGEWASLIIHESGCDPLAVSNRGAVGLSQVRVVVHGKDCGAPAANLFDPETNLRCGAKILLDYRRRFPYNYLQRYHGISSDGKHERYEAAVQRGTAQ